MSHSDTPESKKQWQDQGTTASASAASGAPDPLSSHQGQPTLGQQGQNAQYLGRVVLELWETSHSDQVALSVDPVSVDSGTLLKRASAALSTKIQKGLHP